LPAIWECENAAEAAALQNPVAALDFAEPM
jgi:hypothetical protein